MTRSIAALALLLLTSPPPAGASPAPCLEQTWQLRLKAPNRSDLSPSLDRGNASYQCSVTGSRGHTQLYLSSVEMLTQQSAGYCLPWSMASYQTFVILDRAHYLGLSAERELAAHRACIDQIRVGFQALTSPSSFTCFYARLDGLLPALAACLKGKETNDPDLGRAALYSCHRALFGERDGCGPGCR